MDVLHKDDLLRLRLKKERQLDASAMFNFETFIAFMVSDGLVIVVCRWAQRRLLH